ncbi:alpha/beta fold hydrolase [Mycobacterium sp. 4858]|uniref:alpha/beta fold hydrolase n=1 Tax=Mycobacterium sp. 4858 TaxID=2057185 RepID=UPI001304ADC1|nr:alpha/beta hydrolase [Mycobacterium sp. 4858]
MSISADLGQERRVVIPQGAINYRDRGDGPPIVFVHGVGVNGDLWRNIVPRLARSHRCITPDLPWGSHSLPLKADADLSLPGMARITADFIAALGLDDVTIVANDTGGAVAQALVGRHPERIARLVLTSCDAFEKFPPTPQKYLEVMARSRLLTWIVAYTAQFKAIQRLPTAYGFVTSRPMPPDIMRSFTDPVRLNPGVRRDFRRMLRAVDTKYTFEAADRLTGFDKPALVLWADNDKIFPRDHGRRLAKLLPQGQFELIAGSRTFIPEEQPDRLVTAIEGFLDAHPTRAE